MQPRFNIERDRENILFHRSYKNDFCLFQFHGQIELYFVDEGEMELTVNGESAMLTAGEMSVALSFSPHIYRTPVASRSSVLLIPRDLVEEFVKDARGRRLTCPFIRDKAVVAELKELYNRLADGGVSTITRLGILYTMLGKITDTVGLVDAAKPAETDLGLKILFFINENYAKGITPSSVSTHFGYNQSYMSRYFKSCFGITLSRYITTVKLRSAAHMMLDGRLGVTHAALESGFSSMRTFYRTFAEEYGMTPKEYIDSYNKKG